MPERQSDAWLSLDDAAARFGVSRLRLREAIAAGGLRAQRDNRGFWRVWADAESDVSLKAAAARLAPDQLIRALFDEIEELTIALGDRGAEIEHLSGLAARQQALLERAVALAERAPAGEVDRIAALHARSQALADRALASLEKRDAELGQMTGLMDRALDAVAGLDAEVGRQRETSRQQRALLDRVFEVARSSLERLGADGRTTGWLGRIWGRLSGAGE